MKRSYLLGAIVGSVLLLSQADSTAQIVINEFVYDDGGTDDREFLELYNSGEASVNIGGWVLQSRDNGATPVGPTVTVTSGATIAPGGYYVIGYASVPNVNQTITGASGFFENDSETLELYDGPPATATLQDAVVYEGWRGPTSGGTSSYGTLPAAVTSQMGTPYWGQKQTVDAAAGLAAVSVARYVNGVDSNNNGRDFGLRPPTPGAANSVGTVSAFISPNVDSLANGAAVGGMVGSFVGARAITPGTVVAGLNPNAIPASPGATKAIVAWDGSGGGNATVSESIFSGAGSFDLSVYIDTRHIGLNSNASNVKFTGSELTMFGLGSSDSLAALADISGKVGLANTAVGQNGASGVMWYYEKVGESVLGLDDVSQKLYLVDAGDSGDGNADSATFDWTILATIDLAGMPSDWYRLSLSVNPDGSGTGIFGSQTFNFNTSTGLTGEFFVTYRENTQLGAVTVPEFVRPPTYVQTPEPSTLALAAIGGLALLAWRRRV